MAKRTKNSKGLVKGDKLRDLILLVYMNNKFGKGENDISKLRETLGYSPGGIYSAIESSGYFDKRTDGIFLTKEGEDYLKERILPPYDIFRLLGIAIIFISSILMVQWFEWTYLRTNLVFPWYSNLTFLALGLILLFMLRIKYMMAKRKKMDFL